MSGPIIWLCRFRAWIEKRNPAPLEIRTETPVKPDAPKAAEKPAITQPAPKDSVCKARKVAAILKQIKNTKTADDIPW